MFLSQIGDFCQTFETDEKFCWGIHVGCVLLLIDTKGTEARTDMILDYSV